MPSYSKHEVFLVRYPFSDLSSTKVRPAAVVHPPHVLQDNLIVPLTSHTTALLAGEFALSDWAFAGLHLPTAVKRRIYTILSRLILKRLGQLSPSDGQQLDDSLRVWLGL